MAADELTKALLREEVATPRAIAEALFASVNGGVPLLQALVDSGAATPEIISRLLSRSDVPFLRQVVPVNDIVDRLPRGLCQRLLAVPVRRDAITGTVDVVVADERDPHPAAEIAFHLKAPVRVVRAPVSAIEEALRRIRMRSRDEVPIAVALAPGAASPVDRFRLAAAAATAEERGAVQPHQALGRQGDELYDSRPTGQRYSWAPTDGMVAPPQMTPSGKPVTYENEMRSELPPPVELLSQSMPSQLPPRKGGLVIDTDNDSVPPPPPLPGARIRTPPWGTPIHAMHSPFPPKPGTEPPRSGYGSEIPIPLTRRTFHPGAIGRPTGPSGTERPPPPPVKVPAAPAVPQTGLGEGYAFDPTGLRDVVEKSPSPRIQTAAPPPGGHHHHRQSAHGSLASLPAFGQPVGSFIPGPPPLPGMGPFSAYAPQLPFPEMGGILAALRNAGSRDEVLELVLTGARMVALKVALFVVKKGGYHGWVGTPEFAERSQLQSILIPLSAASIFDRAVREDLYLGPIRYDEIHAPLLRIMRNPSRDVAAVPIRVSGKTAVIIMADELGDTMIGTRRLEELAKAAGEAFARIVRTRR